MAVVHAAPKWSSNEGVLDRLTASLGTVLRREEQHGEIVLTVARDKIVEALTILRDAEGYQQLMEMAGVDYPIASSASRWSTCCSR
jgi:NADH-quinone oxidoreductase subunit C